MTASPWRDPPLTGTPLDYVPIDAPILNVLDDTPERMSRLWVCACVIGAFAIGIIAGALL